MSKIAGCTQMRVIIPDAFKTELQREQQERIRQGRKKLSLADLLVLRAIGNSLALAHLREIQQEKGGEELCKL